MSMYEGAEQVLCSEWVEARLKGHTAFEGIANGLTERVYSDFAPTDAPYPYLIYQVQTPARDVRGVGPVRVMVDTLYVVKAVAQVETYAPLRPLAKEIDAAMTSPDVSPFADAFVLSSTREDQFSLVEVEAGKQFRHLGGQYRLFAQAHS